MIAYKDYLALCDSTNSAERGQAAHFAASAFIAHKGPADENAALYAAVMGFLDDASVKVRASLAYGLLHSAKAPRPVMLALLHDAPIIARAVAQYSPILLDVDLIGCLTTPNPVMERAIASRENLGNGVAKLLLARGSAQIILQLLARQDIAVDLSTFRQLAAWAEKSPQLRGALLERDDLPGGVRFTLVDQVKQALGALRIVKGAVAPRRLVRIMRDAQDTAMTSIGELEVENGQTNFLSDLISDGRISARLLLHALICGRVQFFAACLGLLTGMPRGKVISILEKGGRPALMALFERGGLGDVSGQLLSSLVGHARTANLADDISARYFVVTVLIEELIIEFEGAIPEELQESFAYLNEQNITLARCSARGVLASFAQAAPSELALPISHSDGRSLKVAA